MHHLVRVGVLGHIVLFKSMEALRYHRGTSVICRTSRGLEMGTVLNEHQTTVDDGSMSGRILRCATPEDHLLWARIERDRDRAYAACQKLLGEHAIPNSLIDAEVLFDGSSVLFYFLGEITPDIEALTGELARTYEGNIRLQQFAQAMAAGCGPACGTEDAAGCGSGGCSTCSVAAQCGAKQAVRNDP